MLKELPIILLLGAVSCTSATVGGFLTRTEMEANPQDLAIQFEQEYRHYRTTGERSAQLQHFYKTLRLPSHFQDIYWERQDESKSRLKCLLCDMTMALIINYRRYDNSTDDFIESVVEDMCTWFNIQSPAVCKGAIETNIDILLFVIDNNRKLEAGMMCGIVFQGYGCGSDNPNLEWTVNIDEDKPQITHEPLVQPLYDDGDVFRIVHIGDLHIDPKYMVGGNSNCNEPTCCRAKMEPLIGSTYAAAGKWAEYNRCDLPWHTAEDLVANIMKKHGKIDVIYFTGDIIDHVVWETSIKQNTKVIKEALAMFKTTFGDIPVLPVLGNHESHPLNTFAPREIQGELSTQWLYDLVADEWGKWLPEGTKETIRKGGYYTVLVRDGFRVITLNNNECYVFNWWIMYDPTFPAEQLNWLADTLLGAEEANEKVHILNHLPPGDSECFRTWAREYRKIVNRFSHIIKGQFNGHTHYDEWEIFYDLENSSVANGVSWNGGSVTPYIDVNPNYKVYDVHPRSYDVLDYESWIFNITEANLQPDVNPTWYKLYSFKDTYHVPDLTPKSLNLLAQNMVKHPCLLERYWALKGKKGDPWLKEGCDKTCLNAHLCQMLTSDYRDLSKCDEYIL